MIEGRLTGAAMQRGLFVLALALTAIAPPAQAEYADVVINEQAEKHGMRPVIFPHWFHRIRFTCNVCHNSDGFKMQAGGNNITMAGIADGKFCGLCHNSENKIAWSPDRCDMCHSGLPGLRTGVQRGNQTRGPGSR